LQGLYRISTTSPPRKVNRGSSTGEKRKKIILDPLFESSLIGATRLVVWSAYQTQEPRRLDGSTLAQLPTERRRLKYLRKRTWL
jgi:hypothetical protein